MQKHKTIPLMELKKLNKLVNVNLKHKESLTLLDKVAIFITKIVGTMWCAIVFALIALIGLPDAIAEGKAGVVTWVTQTFLQLVLFSVIMVGQNLQNRHAQKREDVNFDVNVKAELEIETVLEHLENQEETLTQILKKLENK